MGILTFDVAFDDSRIGTFKAAVPFELLSAFVDCLRTVTSAAVISADCEARDVMRPGPSGVADMDLEEFLSYMSPEDTELWEGY